MALPEVTTPHADADRDAPQKGAVSDVEGTKPHQRLSTLLKCLSVGVTLILACVILLAALAPPSATISGGINDTRRDMLTQKLREWLDE